MKKKDWKHVFHQSLSGFLSLAMAILFFFVLHRFSDLKGLIGWILKILSPFLYGGIFAYLLRSPCNFFKRFLDNHLPAKLKKGANGLSVGLVFFLALGSIYLLLSLFIPQLAESILQLSYQLQEEVPALITRITNTTFFKDNEEMQSFVTSSLNSLFSAAENWLTSTLVPSLGTMLSGITTTVGSILSILYNILIGLIVCVYLLLGRKKFARHGKAIVYAVFKPELADRIMTELAFVDDTFRGFFAGKILDSAIVGLICYVFCLIMTFITDFANPLLIAVIIGVTNIIPYFGPFIGAIPAAFLILMSSRTGFLVFVIFIVILQQFDGNFLGPKLLSGTVGLPGFWVLFSITLFGGLFGFAGILIGVPIFAVLYHLVRRLVIKGLNRHNRLEILTGHSAEFPPEVFPPEVFPPENAEKEEGNTPS